MRKFLTDKIQDDAGKIIANTHIDDIYLLIGESLPQKTKDILFLIDDFSKRQLPSAERKLLPTPEDAIKNESAGKTVFSSFKRVIHNSICDPKSEVYKAWYTNGVGAVLDKKYITGAVIAVFAQLSIGIYAIVVSVVALILRFGLDVYCDLYKPLGIMEMRKK